MGTEPMHGPLGLAIFWIWLGLVVFAVLLYGLLRPWLSRARAKRQRAVKYAEQLRQRMRNSAQARATHPPDGADPARRTTFPKK